LPSWLSREAEIAAAVGYDAALLSVGDWKNEPEAEILELDDDSVRIP